MTLSRWKIELGVIAVLLVIILSVWWFVSTKDERTANAEIEVLIKFAQRQALEIAIIEQRSKLLNYKRQLAANRQPKISQPPMSAPVVPVIADPVDVTE